MGVKNIIGELQVNGDIVATQKWVSENGNGSGAVGEKEIIVVDIMTMIATQDNASFVDLSKRYINGEIIIIGQMGSDNAFISAISDKGEGNYAWSLVTSTWMINQPNLSEANVVVFGIENSDGLIHFGMQYYPISDYVTRTDMEDYVIELPYNVNGLTDEEMAKWRAMTNSVGSEDYAQAGKAGVIKTSTSYGLSMTYAGDGIIAIYPADKDTIKAKTGTKGHTNPIVPDNLDYAVKVGLTTNTETLTDDEKASACEWIGALKAITNTYGLNIFRVYCVDNNGIQQIISTTDNTNVLASQKYVDTLPDKLTLTDDEKAKWCGMIGATKLYLHTISVENSTDKLYIVSKNKTQYLSSTSFFSEAIRDVISITDEKKDTIKIVFPKNGYQLYRVYLDEDLSVKTELSVFSTTWNDTVTEL